MKVKFLNYETISYIKNNRAKIHKDLENQTFIEHLEEKFKFDWYISSKFLKPNFNFFMDKNINPKLTDFENSKLMYTYYKNLTESQASDERFWAGLAIEEKNYEYLKYRWKDDDKTIRYRVVYHAGGKRGFMYHGLARLWWFAHITYDESLDNPFELTEFCFKHPHILEKMLYRNYSNSKKVRNGIIKAVKKYEEDGGIYKIQFLDKLFNHFSALSGVHILDAFSEKEIEEIAVNQLYLYSKNQ